MAVGTPTVPVTATADTGNVASYATGSWTPVANRLYLAAVANSDAADAILPTLSGNGLTWVQVATIQAPTSLLFRITLFRALGASPSTGTTTADFAGDSQTGCAILIAEFTGIDTGGTNGSAAIVQSVTGFVDPSSAADPSATLAAIASAGNAAYGVFVSGASFTAPGSGFTNLHSNTYATPSRFHYSEYSLGSANTVVTAAAGAGVSCVIGVEVAEAPAATKTPYTQPMRQMTAH